MTFAEGSRVKHKAKSGVFMEVTGKKKNARYVSGTHAKVLFDGNKRPSVVPIAELTKEETK